MMSERSYLLRRRKLIVERYSPATGEVRRGIPADLPPADFAAVLLWRVMAGLAVGVAASVTGGAIFVLGTHIPLSVLAAMLLVTLLVAAGAIRQLLLRERRRAMKTIINAYIEARRSERRRSSERRSSRGSGSGLDPDDPSNSGYIAPP